jgi:phospholipid transport system transporter-binding protein
MNFAPTVLTQAEAADVVRAGLQALADGATGIDLGGLQRFDSTAVAALLEWRRAAAARGVPLRVTGMPDGLESLARVYGVSDLLQG